jgi:hypothetical protein
MAGQPGGVENSPPQRIVFEGRWIETAVEQKREEMLYRRAHKEVEASVLKRFGQTAALSSFDSKSTIVTRLEKTGSFLVVAILTRGNLRHQDVIFEVNRSDDGVWTIVQFQNTE